MTKNPYWLQTKEVREKNRKAILKGYENGRDPYWKGKKRESLSKKMKEQYKNGNRKIARLTNESNPAWKGEKAGYSALHKWLYKRKKKNNVCEMCGTKVAKKYEFANISGEYKREVDDFMEVCTRCHRQYDNERVYA